EAALLRGREAGLERLAHIRTHLARLSPCGRSACQQGRDRQGGSAATECPDLLEVQHVHPSNQPAQPASSVSPAAASPSAGAAPSGSPSTGSAPAGAAEPPRSSATRSHSSAMPPYSPPTFW